MNHFQVTRSLSLISSLLMTYSTPSSPPTLNHPPPSFLGSDVGEMVPIDMFQI